MAVIRFTDTSLSFGEHKLFDHMNLSIEAGERVCIVGRNGTGKSTILKVMEGLQDIDSGSIVLEQGTVIKRLQQDPPDKLDITTYQYIAQGLAHASEVLSTYHQCLEQLTTISHQLTTATGNQATKLQQQLDKVHHDMAQAQYIIDEQGYWELDLLINKIATQLQIPLDRKLTSFSGGWLRRIELARTLVAQPNVLLLDEPTNHLDISSIRWLEQELLNYHGTIIFISHDRTFVNHLATRVIELDRGKVYSHPGNFEAYIELRDKRMEDERNQLALFEKNLAKEEVWIRKGIEARRTRNEGRVRALEAMRAEHANLRKVQNFGEINIGTATKSGKLVFELKDVGLELPAGNVIFEHLTTKVSSGSKIALVGDNGVGKTSLIRVLLKQLEPTHGTVHIGTNLEVAYFDQLRMILDPEKTAIENIFDGKMEAHVHGMMRHAIGYLQDFLFTPEKARSKVSTLSGGERNRLLLAKILAKDSNLLILDEPTNDLDIETLELLEDIVAEYKGTVIIVSHDRSFIDNLALETWFIEHQRVWMYIGGYEENIANHEALVQAYLAKQAKSQAQAGLTPTSTTPVAPTGRNMSNVGAGTATNTDTTHNTTSSNGKTPRVQLRKPKMSYKEERELQALPAELEELEQAVVATNTKIATLHQQGVPYSEIEATYQELRELEAQIETKMERWAELEEKQQQLTQ